MMNSVTAVASSQDTRAIPESLRRTIDEAQVTMTELRTAVEELRQSGAVGNVSRATAQADELMTRLNAAAERVPTIVEQLDKASASISEVDFAALSTEMQAALGDVRAVVGSDAALSLPGEISTALTNVGNAAQGFGEVAQDLQASQAGPKLAQALDDASAAFVAVNEAALDIPEMVDSLDSAATSIDEFDFAGIGDEAKGLIGDLRAMLGTEDAAQLPRNLSDTLKAASGLLNDLRDGNAAGSLNAALASARRAMDQVAVAANTLPALSQRYQALATRGEGVIATFGDRGAFQTEIINTLRSLRRAAESFGSLSDTIERNPRAFILGR